MLAIMKSIYDMMGRYTYPCVRDEAPYEHVDKFFQVLTKHTNNTKILLKSRYLKFCKSITAKRRETFLTPHFFVCMIDAFTENG